MQRLARLLLLPVTAAGFYFGGWRGGLTGLLSTMFIGIGLAYALGERKFGSERMPVRIHNHVGGLIMVVLAIAGALFGGWRTGGFWAFGGYFVGMVAAMFIVKAKEL